VLAKHWPEVPIYDDVRTLTAERLAADGISVDVICGGFPCQDISIASMQRWTGIDGERSGLWAEYCRIIGDIRPRYAIVENTAALLERGLGRVLGDLASIRYDAEWHCVTAAAVNAPHLRDRIWLVAYPHGERLEGQYGHWQSPRHIGGSGHGTTRLLSAITAEDWLPEPGVYRVDDGTPDRVERTRALGNSLVPQIPELIGRAILAAERRP
jgi:DNA (cytosine-5)-methyltransferase 1